RYMATAEDVEPITLAGVRERARTLRPSLRETPANDIAPEEAGWPVGVLRPVSARRPVELRGSWEDVAVEIMAPRSGKTSAGAVPTILQAPGTVVVTSNKADVWAATAALRHRDTGEEPWLFDPSGIAPRRQTWWWNPLEDI